MAKLTLSDVSNLLGSPTSAATTINSNNDLIEAALENTLSRDGSTPNQMNSDLDMNTYDILNGDKIYGQEIYADGVKLEPFEFAALTDLINRLESAVNGMPKNTPQGRLSLSNATSISPADLTSTSIFLHPVGGNLVPIWDGIEFVWRSIGSLLTLNLDSNTLHPAYTASGYNYDLYVTYNAGAVRLVHVGSWATGAIPSPNIHKERATGTGSVQLARINGVLVNQNALTARFGNGSSDIFTMPALQGTYVGTFRATADGQAKDTYRQRLLYNAYNQTFRALKRLETTASWVYSGATFALMNSSLLNQIEVLFGLESNITDLTLNVFVSNSTATNRTCYVGLGVDSLTDAFGTNAPAVAHQNLGQITARYADYTGMGLTTLSILTAGAGADTQTWWEGSGVRGQVLL